MAFSIRRLMPRDRARWRELFQAYIDFYNDTVKNQGTDSAAGGFSMSYYLSTDTTYEVGTDLALVSEIDRISPCSRTRTSSLSKNASHNVNGTICHKPTSAVNGVNYYVLVVDDNFNTVIESNENNNVKATAGTIKW